MVGVAVRVAIDKTPVAGLDVYFYGESNTLVTSSAQTNESGIAMQLVGDTDMMTISSGLEAISFNPVSGPATALHALGIIDVSASRSLQAGSVCRYSDLLNQEFLAFYAFNSATKNLFVPQRRSLNSLHAGDGSPTRTQPRESFPPGLSLFTVPLSEFRTGGGFVSCRFGMWRFLGAERQLSCSVSQAGPNVPLCENQAMLPCVALDESVLKRVRAIVRQARKRVGRLEQEMKLLYPAENRRYSTTRDLIKGTRRIRSLISEIKMMVSSCSVTNPRCSEFKLPRTKFAKAFRRAFGPRPARGRRYFRSVRAYYVTKFRRILSSFPSRLVKCD
jgi:hypothetical protein